MSQFQLKRATRKKAKLRIGLSGPSGSGKTYSALLLASGIAPWEKIALIDTENGSGELYSHLGPYNVITLTAPFTPERYIEAIEECEKAGMEVIVIDSGSHEWEGAGGCLESNDKVAQLRFKGNTWAAWSVTTPRHQAFINKILTSPCHQIVTLRSKTDTMQQDGKVKKIGTKEIQREGTEYEFSLHFNLDRDSHLAIASKDRTEIFEGKDPFVISQATGEELIQWANEGEEPPAPQLPPQKIQSKKIQPIQIKMINELWSDWVDGDDIVESGERLKKNLEKNFKKSSVALLSEEEAGLFIEKLSKLLDKRAEENEQKEPEPLPSTEVNSPKLEDIKGDEKKEKVQECKTPVYSLLEMENLIKGLKTERELLALKSELTNLFANNELRIEDFEKSLSIIESKITAIQNKKNNQKEQSLPLTSN